MLIDIHTHQQNNSKHPQLISYNLNQQSNFKPFCSIGIYPFDIPITNLIDKLTEMASSDFIAAIGETGVDNRKEFRKSIEAQKKLFKAHIEIANNNSKPLIIHQVKAIDETLKILKNATVPVIFHGFTGSSDTAKQIISKGYYISFGAFLLNNERLQQVLKQIPLTNIFFETDASTISIDQVYQKAADLTQIDNQTLQNIIEQNFYDTGLAATYRALAGAR